MRFQRSAPILFCVLSAVFSWKAQAQIKPRIAVYPFDDRTTANKDMQIGAKVADLLISKLTASGAFTVFDRQYVDKILEENHRKYDPNYDSASAAKAGLLGTVDLVVAGQIDAYNATTKVNDTNLVIGTLHEIDGVVSLKATARLISVEKGSIAAAPSASNDQKPVLCKAKTLKGTSLGSCSQNQEQELRRYVDEAAEEVAKQLSSQISPLAAAIQPVVGPIPPSPKKDEAAKSDGGTKPGSNTVNALFLGVSEGLVYIDKGTAAGVKVGDKFIVRRSIPTGINDGNGNPIFRHKSVCTAVITSVEDTSAAGKCVPEPPAKGPEAVPHKGDEVLLSSK